MSFLSSILGGDGAKGGGTSNLETGKASFSDQVVDRIASNVGTHQPQTDYGQAPSTAQGLGAYQEIGVPLGQQNRQIAPQIDTPQSVIDAIINNTTQPQPYNNQNILLASLQERLR